MVYVTYIHKLLFVLTLPSRKYRSDGIAWPREDITTLGQTDKLRLIAAWIEADGHDLDGKKQESNSEMDRITRHIHNSYATYLRPVAIIANQMHGDR